METFSSISMKNKYKIGMFIHRFMFIYSRDVANEIFKPRNIANTWSVKHSNIYYK